MSDYNGGISESNLGYLEIMRDIGEMSADCSVKTYIWGGFTADVFEGRFLREHHDLDGFTESLADNLDKLISGYQKRGFTTEYKSDFSMLVIRRGGLHAAFNQLDADHGVAMWRHIGGRGTVYFPYEWLDAAPRDFYGVPVYTSGLRFEYGFRSIACDVNPGWTEREKDKAARGYLRAELEKQGADAAALLKSIWSYNPFWLEYGYAPFEKPVLVCPARL